MGGPGCVRVVGERETHWSQGGAWRGLGRRGWLRPVAALSGQGGPDAEAVVFLSPSAGPGILGSEESVGETVIGTLGKSATLPLEIPVGQEVEKVTWSSRGLVAILQPGPAGEPILVAGNQGPYSQRLSIPCHSYSLQISSLRLQDSGPYRAWITLHSPPINITKDFILHVYGEGLEGLRLDLTFPLLCLARLEPSHSLNLPFLAQRNRRSPKSQPALRS